MISNIKKNFGTKDRLNVRDISDLHFGHNRTSSWEILRSVRWAVPDDESMRDCDILFISGDVTDRLIDLGNAAAYCYNMAIIHIATVCLKYDVVLRLLHGTKSHERDQPIQFTYWIENNFPDLDFKYQTRLSLEYMERFDINVLYVPDEWNPDASKTLAEAKALLAASGLSQADIAITHCAYTCQLNGFTSPSYFDPVEWNALVTLQVFSGHVHTAGKFDKILIPGSLQRTGHDQEEDKGFWDVTYYDREHSKEVFRVNPHAKIYRTYNLDGLSIRDIIQIIADDNYPKGSAIRLEYSDDQGPTYMNILQDIYPDYVITIIKRGVKKEKVITNDFIKTKFVPTPIHQENITNLVLNRVGDKEDETVKERIAYFLEV